MAHTTHGIIAPVVATRKTERGAHQAAARIVGPGQGAAVQLADGSGWVAVDLRASRWESKRNTWVKIAAGHADIISQTGWTLIAAA